MLVIGNGSINGLISPFGDGPRREKTCLRWLANTKGANQPAHPRSLISAFDISLLESIISRLATGKISIFQLVSVAEQAGLNLTLSETPNVLSRRDLNKEENYVRDHLCTYAQPILSLAYCQRYLNMIRSNHNQTLQPNPRHREEEPQNTYSNKN